MAYDRAKRAARLETDRPRQASRQIGRQVPKASTRTRRIAEHARAVFATLAEAVSIKEWCDVIVEPPEEYHGLSPPRLA